MSRKKIKGTGAQAAFDAKSKAATGRATARYWLPVASACMLLAGISPSAWPQSADTASSDQLQEVVVTAQKREVNLQKVSESIQVKSGEELRLEGKQRLDEIMQGTVGIQAQDNRLGLTFFVRGVDASAGQPGTIVPSPVAILVDGVPETRSEVVRGDTLDLAQAEIMRGPQSTSLGANSLSGAVGLTTNNPVLSQWQALGSVEMGDYSKRAVQGVLNIPLGETTALRVAYSTDQRNGYISSGAGDSDLSTVRAKFRWQPSEDLNTVTELQRQEIGGNGVQQNVLLAYGFWHPITQGNAGSLSLTGTGCGSTNAAVLLMGCPATYYNLEGSGPSFRQRPNAWNDGFPGNAFPNSPFLDTVVDKASETITWNTRVGTLTVLPAFEYATLGDREIPRGGSYMMQFEKEATPSVDVHLDSNTGGPLTWILGAFYMHDKIYNSWTSFVSYSGVVGGPPAPAFCTNPSLTCYEWQDTPEQLNTDESLYASATYAVIPSFRLVAGARLSRDTAKMTTAADIEGSDQGPFAAEATAQAVNSGSYEWKHATFRAGLEYDLTPTTMLYGTYSTGYTPGNFAVAGPGGPPGNPVTANPATTLDQIALGWKSQFFDRKVQLNGEFFSTTVFNRTIQGTINTYIGGANAANCVGSFPPPPGAFTVGSGGGGYCLIVSQDQALAPKLVSNGLDLDGQWLITSRDRLAATLEYLKTQYKGMPQFSNGCYTTACVQALNSSLSSAQAAELSQGMAATLSSFVGATPQNAPVTSITLNYQHVFNLPGGSQIVPRIAGQFKTRYWSFGGAPGANVSQILADSHNSNDLAWQQAYSEWDAYLDWRSANGKFTITGYVKNVGNEVVMDNYTYPYVELAPPRTAGVILNAQL